MVNPRHGAQLCKVDAGLGRKLDGLSVYVGIMASSAALQLVPSFAVTAAEVALDALSSATSRLAHLEAQPPADPGVAFHRVIAAVHHICAALSDAEAAGCSREELREATEAVRGIHSASPFVKRLQDWPRGYPGDFETIEWLCRSVSGAPAGTFAGALEAYALTSAIAQQHRNKVQFQADCIRDAILANPRCRVLSLACGSSPDIRAIAPLAGPESMFVLCDGDAAALDFSRQQLAPIPDLRSPIAARCEFVRGMVPRVLGRVAKYGPFDLVYAGGLFDYLPDRLAIRTLAIAHRTLVAPGGRLVFTNIASGNPFRVWLEYLANWTLIERSNTDIRRLCAEAGLEAPCIERDATGLALLMTIRKA
jgi:extracellular factor (EF) 3-hydroxypalmitic acid methyl ester biosynthesis protein